MSNHSIASKNKDNPANGKQLPDSQMPSNLKEQGQAGNLRQNIKNQGRQQDR